MAPALVSACEALRATGVREITIMATHGLFTGSGWQRLWTLGVRRIDVTDTTPLPPPLASCTAIVRLSVVPLLGPQLTDLTNPLAPDRHLEG